MLGTHALPRPTEVRLRDYQQAAIDAIRHRLYREGDDSTLLVVATGCGKTVIFGSIARRVAEKGGKTLILVHREELKDQAVETLSALGLDVGVEKAESYARGLFEPHVVVATVQTMQGERLLTWPRDYFKLIITDEAHHATAATYGKVYSHFDAKHLGVTATADRADEDDLGDVFDSVAYTYSLWQAMSAPAPGPYLSRVRFEQCPVQIDLRSIRTAGGDYSAADIERLIVPHIVKLANAIKQEVGDRKTLVFTPDVTSAQLMADTLDGIGVRAKWVAGDSADRKEVVAGFKRGEFQALANCSMLTEGFDCPDVAAIALCRPTKSRALYAQMVGRGTRLAEGKKNCLLIDFDWLTLKHDLVKPVELFDSGNVDAETLAIAAELLKGSRGIDVMEAVERADAEKSRRVSLRVKAREMQVKYRKVSYDPLAVMETFGVPVRAEADRFRGTITEGQKNALERFGLTGLGECSKARASRILDAVIGRKEAGLASPKKLSWLIAKGIEPAVARSMTREQADEALDRLFQRRA